MIECPDHGTVKYLQWSFRSERASLIRKLSPVADELCLRCKDLDILSMFGQDLTWSNFSVPIPAWQYSKSKAHRDLGSAETLRFDRRCGLCIALFNITPSPGTRRGNVHLVADWTIHRIEQLVDVKHHQGCHFDTYIIAEILNEGQPFNLGPHKGDVLGVQRSSSQGLSCSGVKLGPDQFDLEGLKILLSTCEHKHELTCASQQSDSLFNITLVDVTTRRLVSYPEQGCKYTALSYVWGETKPPRPDSHGILPTMPATIEDAIRVTHMLGHQYLWVDALCIDQKNEKEKANQIAIMADIYRGAYATIIALSGESSNHGLTRLGHNNKTLPQLSCTVDGVSLVGLMPTLPTQMLYQKWASRSWTLQEALLSQRSIYFTDHQVYFECNAMQTCETIDTSQSWIHNATRDLATYTNNPNGTILGHGTLRNAPVLPGISDRPREAYGTLISLYSRREMSFEEDTLNAFGGIMQHLKDLGYVNGFCWGLPEDDLNWSLNWCALTNLTRREQFPAWSWAGWRGIISPGWPSNLKSDVTQRYKTHFYAWTFDGSSMRQVFPHDEALMSEERLFPTGDTPFHLRASPHVDRILEERCTTAGTSKSYLLLDCLVFHARMIPGDACPAWDFGPWKHYCVAFNNVACHIRLPSINDRARLANPETSYLLTGRDRISHGGVMYVAHHFLDVDIDEDGKALRQGVVQLIVPESSPQALALADVARRSVILI